ncbi:hypothetical protein D4764_04G0010000 [Takifugu flavidus]|uniref:DUF5641 domain-containing protein n=1 Tax=Takifugu flavidus TaxID=433684 RepID=A0A5C6N552_9TELE|nr:hypothetical protein D4764_04G0010000 [Takifugu flavidus]
MPDDAKQQAILPKDLHITKLVLRHIHDITAHAGRNHMLAQLFKEQQLDEEGLHTLLCEAEAVINSRPITNTSSDLNDLEALTPNYLLLLRVKSELPPGVFHKEDQYANRRWKQVQFLADAFWKHWCKEYLTQLQECQRWSSPGGNFCVGDVVLIVDDTSPRNSWQLGRIVETFPDRHGLVHEVKVKTKTNEPCCPITKLCLLQESEDN